MRLEDFGLRSWLLAAFAGWAALVCVLALFGLGSRVQAGEAPGPPPPLPALPAAASERLGAATAYADIAARPLFAADRQPHPFFLGGGEAQPAGAGLRLTGVLITPGLQMATLSGEQGLSLRLRLNGEPVQGWRLLALEPRAATVEGPSGTQTLALEVFSGSGKPAAGAAAVPPPAAVAASEAASEAAKPRIAAEPPPSQTPPAPSEDQLKAIRERIEARRRELRERQNGGAPGKQP